MMNGLSRLALGLAVLVLVILGVPGIAQAQTNPAELAKAVTAIENLDALRSGLASYLKDAPETPTAETFKQVCKPVGMKAMELSQENGWQVKQISQKYRNPAHAPDTPQSTQVLAEFEQNPELIGLWERASLDGKSGTRYYRRINVEASCLACHGAQEARPQFVQDNYPQDLAYNFKVGDLRGMYAVFIPDVQQALQEAVSQ
ncbi:MAG TPA: DUF3365 domain-containing protein [Leptolyngbyaceae cyanobacterium M65_K2018_010]|nr:DUF3365 domain-containing protein [Leptolyngbyaceae cyanobacterium M65_K2018_010]